MKTAVRTQVEPDMAAVGRVLSGMPCPTGPEENEAILGRLVELRLRWPEGNSWRHKDSEFWSAAQLVADSLGASLAEVMAEVVKHRERVWRRARYARQRDDVKALKD